MVRELGYTLVFQEKSEPKNSIHEDIWEYIRHCKIMAGRISVHLAVDSLARHQGGLLWRRASIAAHAPLRKRGLMDKTLVALGWDVGGWLGQHQATAVALFASGSRAVEWLGISEPFPFEKGSVPGFTALAVPALGANAVRTILSAEKIAIAIDAPLGFPEAFRKLLCGKPEDYPVPHREIENPLAYRDCERWVENQFRKKPLSGPFDKLGNNASLAMSVAFELEREGFTIVPQHKPHADRAVIEVYPAIVKTGPRRTDPAVPSLARHLPGGLEPGTDHYDAAICALSGLVYLGAGPSLDLPGLVPFPSNADPQEGWIFTFPREFLPEGH